MFPGGWTAAARHAGAEPLWTGRARPYDPSTLRKAADRLEAAGCADVVRAALWQQVTTAVDAADEAVVAYTDVFDQPSYTKKPAHAAPIGSLGNRLLAATYFGLTTVAIPEGPTLFAHLSWHKPAAPLRDAIEALVADDRRLDWWHDHVRLHILDRGANGDPVLRWCADWEIPYLTIGRRSADLWRLRVPTVRTETGLPIVLRPDARLGGTEEEGPWEVIVPARPQDPAATRGLRFRVGVALTVQDLVSLNAQYKARWPSMENEIKALVSRGFARNRTRRLETTTSRGTDGAVERLQTRYEALEGRLEELTAQWPRGRDLQRIERTAQQMAQVRRKRAAVVAEAEPKGARPCGGAEWRSKWLHLLAHNALALALYRSPEEAVRTMSPARVFDLLLDQPALSCLSADRLVMSVERVGDAADRRAQASLVELFNSLRLRCRGLRVEIRLHDAPAMTGP